MDLAFSKRDYLQPETQHFGAVKTSFESFQRFWRENTGDTLSQRNIEMLFELLDTSCQKLNRYVRFCRQQETKGGLKEESRAEILKKFDTIDQSQLLRLKASMYEISRQCFPSTAGVEELPPFPSVLENTLEIFNEYHSYLKLRCRKDAFKEKVAIARELFSSQGFFAMGSTIRAEVLDAISRLEEAYPLTKTSQNAMEKDLLEVFKLSFGPKAPFLHDRMNTLFHFQYPEKYKIFFKPALVAAFKSHYIRTLNLTWKNGLTETPCPLHLLEVVAEASRLTTRPLVVTLDNVGITDKTLEALRPLFQSDVSQIHLRNNEISKKGMLKIAEWSKDSPKLKVIDLLGNDIRDDKTDTYLENFPEGINVFIPGVQT